MLFSFLALSLINVSLKKEYKIMFIYSSLNEILIVKDDIYKDGHYQISNTIESKEKHLIKSTFLSSFKMFH